MNKKFVSFLPSVVFIAFIGIMTALFFVLPKQDYSSSEKRYLSEFPTLTASSFFKGDFGEDFEKYLSDHTAFRNFYVGLNSYYNLALGNPLSNGIYHCNNGYLVNDPPDTSLLATNVDVIAEFSQKHDIKTTMILAPSSGYVMSDILPNSYIKYEDDALFAKTAEILNDNGVEFVDVRDTFKTAYQNGTQVYYRTDHHWTSEGAHLAYTQLSTYMGFTANDKQAYHIDTYDDFYGTTYSSSGYWLTEPDYIELWQKNDGNNITVEITDGASKTQQDSMFYLNNLTQDDKYPVFLNGNRPYTVITNNSFKNGEKLLVIKDSFAHTLVPFLADHYEQIVMIDMRYYKQSVSELIESSDFDQILFVYSIDNLSTDADIRWLE